MNEKKTAPAGKRDDADRPRLKKETLRGLGFTELEQVHGGDPGVNQGNQGHPKPIATRYCLG